MSHREVTSLSAFVQNSGNSGRERWLLRATWTAAVIGGDRVGGGRWGIRLSNRVGQIAVGCVGTDRLVICADELVRGS